MKKILRLLAIAGILAVSPAIATAGTWSPGSAPPAPTPMRGAVLECRGDHRGERDRERERWERERRERERREHHRRHHHRHIIIERW